MTDTAANSAAEIVGGVRYETRFRRIPDLFALLYDDQLQTWAQNFRRIGPVFPVKLRQPVEPLAVSRDFRRIVGVRLSAEVDLSRPEVVVIEVRPQTDADEEAIARHIRDMQGRVLH